MLERKDIPTEEFDEVSEEDELDLEREYVDTPNRIMLLANSLTEISNALSV
jgi:hypothetical protein